MLASYERGRSHSQLLNRWDTCCFGEEQHEGEVPYLEAMAELERLVRERLGEVGEGSFEVEIDETLRGHGIPEATIEGIVGRVSGG